MISGVRYLPFLALLLAAYPTKFQPSVAADARVAAALRAIEGRQEALIRDWIKLAVSRARALGLIRAK